MTSAGWSWWMPRGGSSPGWASRAPRCGKSRLEAGFANGALKPYFPTKDTLLTFAFGHVFNRTNERIREVTAGKAGIPALRAFCVEVLPLDSERVNEARIVVPFWQKAINDPGKAAIHRESMEQWHAAILEYLAEAREHGTVSAAVDDSRRRRPPAEHAAGRADSRRPRPRGPGGSGPGRPAGSLPDPARRPAA